MTVLLRSPCRPADPARPALPLSGHPRASAPAWIERARDAPYFITEEGDAWTPVGHNEAISWPVLAPLFRRRDPAAVQARLGQLAASGVTCLRIMLEYSHREHRYLERPAGVFVPQMVRLWDDLFSLCERTGIRLLLTPFDTFWMWRRWRHHPYNAANGGPCERPSLLLLCPETRMAIKRRLEFATRRWGASGALFGWDLWNEIHPGQAEERTDAWNDFVEDVAGHVRAVEQQMHGRTHLLTVSIFGPELVWRPAMRSTMADAVFRHQALDFASAHVYSEGTIDDPRDTVAPALAMGQIVRELLAEIRDARPFLDSEHGPIHTFKDHHRTLPEAFDDEYFRHIQWAHLASGGAGGGMRWPNRHPHTLTPGMHQAQRALSGFLPLVDWGHLRRRNMSAEMEVAPSTVSVCACGDDHQCVAWLVRRDTIGPDGRLRRDAAPVTVTLRVPGLTCGTYRVTAWDTAAGRACAEWQSYHTGVGPLALRVPPFVADIALIVRFTGAPRR